ncbi:glycosyltransferase [Chloroflexi bacterium TSY]|nr:glycosyltransferase [Chloroflexi bacterium TSY]
MRTLHIVHQYPPHFVGGTELYTQFVVKNLATAHPTALFTRIFANGTGMSKQNRDGVEVYRVWDGQLNPTRRFSTTFRHKGLSRYFANAITDFQPVLVHVQHLFGLPASLIRFLREQSIPFILTLEDYWWICANANLLTNYSDKRCDGPQGYLNCARCIVSRSGQFATWAIAPILPFVLHKRASMLKEILHAAHAIISPSYFVRDWYIAQGVDAMKLRVIPHGMAQLKSVPTLKSASHRIRFLYLGSISPIKGVHVIVDAFRNVVGEAELNIAGNDTLEPLYTTELRQRADQRTRFLGQLSRSEVERALVETDIVLVPSLCHESFCFSAHEALAVGKPLLASRLGALTEAVSEGKNGLLLEAGNVSAWTAAMQQMVDTKAWNQRQVKPVIDLSTPQEHIDQLLEIYAEATA